MKEVLWGKKHSKHSSAKNNVLINNYLKEDIVKLAAATKETTRLSSRERSVRRQIQTISLSKD